MLGGFLRRLAAGFFGTRLEKEDLDDFLEELVEKLMEAGVALQAAERIEVSLRERLVGREVRGNFEEELRRLLKEELVSFFPQPRYSLRNFRTVIVVGPNGVGKTSFCVEVARRTGALFVETDTFRPGALAQAREMAERMGVEALLGREGEKAAGVLARALKTGRRLVVDTAGRQETRFDLLRELEKMKRMASPDALLLTVEGTTGSAALSQAKEFGRLGITEAVITKADIGRPGSVFSVASTGLPVGYLTFQGGYEEFSPRKFVEEFLR